MMLLLPVLFLAAMPVATTPAAKQGLRNATGAVLQGNGAAAHAVLQSVSADHLDDKDRSFRDCALARLDARASAFEIERPDVQEPFARDLLALYRAYWRASAMDKAERPAAERELVIGLSRLLGQPTLEDVGDAEPLIAERLKAGGLFSQQGRTGAFRDLMIWRRNTQRTESVALPEGSNATRVSYLDDFISRGWSSYLTCDRAGTGGWTTSEGLFVVVPSYQSLTDENFRVNFLAHESQHHADKLRFGDLPAWRLEYRAKLVELAYADATCGRVLDNFGSNQGDDRAEPHSYANKRVLEALARRLALPSATGLQSVPVDQLHAAAVALLREDSRELGANSRPAP